VALLAPAPQLLEERTRVAMLGVVPYIHNLGLPEEDAASLEERARPDASVEIAIVRLPHLANFDEFGPLLEEACVSVRYISDPTELRAPDLVILPGTKATIPDLVWLKERGLGDRIRWLAEHATPLLGVCGGYQMLGLQVSDPHRIESDMTATQGLGMLPITTELTVDKRLINVRGSILPNGAGVWRLLGGVAVEGYEIHMGRTHSHAEHAPWLMMDDQAEGSASAHLAVVGTQVHGVLQSHAARTTLVRGLCHSRGFAYPVAQAPDNDPFDRLADVLEASLTLDALERR
jgi:adenosylcobyric acid synthase